MAGYVLIVESDTELQRQIGAALRDAGFDLHAEAEAAWAKKTVATRPPDVIVAGHAPGDGDGFTFASELRQAPETRATPSCSSPAPTAASATARRRDAVSRPPTTCPPRSISRGSCPAWPSWRCARRPTTTTTP